MSEKSIIESYQSFTLRLCMKWSDTYNCSDKEIEEYMLGSIFALLDSEDKDLADLKKKNEAGEELEFLIELMKEQHIRHNLYTLT